MADTNCILALPLRREMLGGEPLDTVLDTLAQAGLLSKRDLVRDDSGPLNRWCVGKVLGTDASVVHDVRADLWYVEMAAPAPSVAAAAQAELQALLPAMPLISLCDTVDGGGAAPGHYLALGLAARGGSGPASAILARALEREDAAMLPFVVEAAALSGDRSLCAALAAVARRHDLPEIVRAVAFARTMLACPAEQPGDGR